MWTNLEFLEQSRIGTADVGPVSQHTDLRERERGANRQHHGVF